MAKGITQFGTLSGTLGDTVFYRSGGEQKQRIRIRRPNNPKTRQQMFQRAKFSAAGMFYAHGKQNFFPYAFEDKKKGESNFNAFMRNNVQQAWPISKTMADTKTYPVFNYWLMSKGSLQPFNCSFTSGSNPGFYAVITCDGTEETLTTMADLSKALIKTNNFENLDIVTFLIISAENVIDDDHPYPRIKMPGSDELFPGNITKPATWSVFQFNLNVNDNNTLASYGIAATKQNGLITLSLTQDSPIYPNYNFMVAGTVIHSRKGKSTTKVSTQNLVLYEDLADSLSDVTGIKAYNSAANLDQDYVNAVVDDWLGIINVTLRPTEILQGANSVNFELQPVQP